MRSLLATGAALAAIALLGFAAPTQGAAFDATEPPTSTVEVSPREARVGDLVEATVTLEFDAGRGGTNGDEIGKPEAPAFPNWQRHWGTAEIREVGEVVRLSGDGPRARYSQTLELTSFRPGTVSLPPVALTVGGAESEVEILTEAQTFEIVSVLPTGDEALEPKPPAPPLPLPLGNRFWGTAGLLTALVILLAGILLTRRRAEGTYAGTPIDPWSALEAALAKLAQTADTEAAFTGLSLELRRYLGRTLAFPAAESTTTELRRRLQRSGLPANVCSDVVRLLVEADTVKFAKQDPAPGRVPGCLAETRVAATAVRDFLRPDEPAEGAARAAGGKEAA